jgi:hypothetical protein
MKTSDDRNDDDNETKNVCMIDVKIPLGGAIQRTCGKEEVHEIRKDIKDM